MNHDSGTLTTTVVMHSKILLLEIKKYFHYPLFKKCSKAPGKIIFKGFGVFFISEGKGLQYRLEFTFLTLKIKKKWNNVEF